MHALSFPSSRPLPFLPTTDRHQAALTLLAKFFQILFAQVAGIGQHNAWLATCRGLKQRKWPQGRETQRMHRLLRLPWAKKIYRYRRTQGERPFAEIKQTMGFRRFATRGRANIQGEWNLVCAAANALTIHRAAQA